MAKERHVKCIMPHIGSGLGNIHAAFQFMSKTKNPNWKIIYPVLLSFDIPMLMKLSSRPRLTQQTSNPQNNIKRPQVW